MTRQGYSITEIALAVGVSDRTVSRYRLQLGLTKPPHVPWTEEEHAFAERLLQDGCPYREVARTLGRDYKTVMRHHPDYPRVPFNPIGGMWEIAERLGLALT
jgi:transposase